MMLGTVGGIASGRAMPIVLSAGLLVGFVVVVVVVVVVLEVRRIVAAGTSWMLWAIVPSSGDRMLAMIGVEDGVGTGGSSFLDDGEMVGRFAASSLVSGVLDDDLTIRVSLKTALLGITTANASVITDNLDFIGLPS